MKYRDPQEWFEKLAKLCEVDPKGLQGIVVTARFDDVPQLEVERILILDDEIEGN